MVSVWRPSENELAQLNAGHGICLFVQGHEHPVVGLGTTETPVDGMPVVP